MATSTNQYLKDNVACVAMMQTGYIASDITIAHLASQIMQQTYTFVHKDVGKRDRKQKKLAYVAITQDHL